MGFRLRRYLAKAVSVLAYRVAVALVGALAVGKLCGLAVAVDDTLVAYASQ